MISQDTFAGNASDPLSLNLYTYCNNNPVSYHDPSGHVPTAVVGALIGGAIGYGVNLFTQLSSNGWNWSSLDQRSLWASAGAGAVSRAMAEMTGGLSLLGSVGSGALIGGANYGTYNLLNGTDPTLEGYTLSMGTGAAMSGITYEISNVGIKGGSTLIRSANPNEIRFSQSSVNGLDKIAASMKKNGWVGDPIDVVRMSDGKLTTIDNTRVLAAREAGIDIKMIVHEAVEALPSNFIDRFTTKKGVPTTWEEAVQLRIQKQNLTFRNANPNGAYEMK